VKAGLGLGRVTRLGFERHETNVLQRT